MEGGREVDRGHEVDLCVIGSIHNKQHDLFKWTCAGELLTSKCKNDGGTA